MIEREFGEVRHSSGPRAMTTIRVKVVTSKGPQPSFDVLNEDRSFGKLSFSTLRIASCARKMSARKTGARKSCAGAFLSAPFSRYRSSTLLTILAFVWCALSTQTLLAAPRDDVLGRTLKESREMDPSTFNLNLSATVDRLIDYSTDTDLYDPLTIQRLRALQEEAQPRTNPTDIDPALTRRVAERALAIQSGRALANVLERSELRETFRDFRDGMRAFQNYFRYSLQKNEEGFTVSRKAKGEKLIELNVDLNLKNGVTPSLRIGDSIRFRMSDDYRTPMLEYGVSW